MEQILQNLTSNALKFSNNGSQIDIELEVLDTCLLLNEKVIDELVEEVKKEALNEDAVFDPERLIYVKF
jgi:signal transduction histidine kinase